MNILTSIGHRVESPAVPRALLPGWIILFKLLPAVFATAFKRSDVVLEQLYCDVAVKFPAGAMEKVTYSDAHRGGARLSSSPATSRRSSLRRTLWTSVYSRSFRRLTALCRLTHDQQCLLGDVITLTNQVLNWREGGVYLFALSQLREVPTTSPPRAILFCPVSSHGEQRSSF